MPAKAVCRGLLLWRLEQMPDIRMISDNLLRTSRQEGQKTRS